MKSSLKFKNFICSPKKKKKMTPVSKICAKAKVEQFPDDFYAILQILSA